MNCNRDHDHRTVRFDQQLAIELSKAYEDGGPENINLRGASPEKLLMVAAYCLTAASEYTDDSGEVRFCCRLHHCNADIANQIAMKFLRTVDELDVPELANVSITGDAVRGGWCR